MEHQRLTSEEYALRIYMDAAREGLLREVAKVVREQVRVELYRPHLQALDERMTLNEAAEYLGYSRSHINELRSRRAKAKTRVEKDRHFAPSYGRDKALRFKRSELDAWFDSTRTD